MLLLNIRIILSVAEKSLTWYFLEGKQHFEARESAGTMCVVLHQKDMLDINLYLCSR